MADFSHPGLSERFVITGVWSCIANLQTFHQSTIRLAGESRSDVLQNIFKITTQVYFTYTSARTGNEMKMKSNIDMKTELSPTYKCKTHTRICISISMFNSLNFARMFNAEHEFWLIYVTFILFIMVYHEI